MITSALDLSGELECVDLVAVDEQDKVGVRDTAVMEEMRRNWVEELVASDTGMAILLPIRILVYAPRNGGVSISYASALRARDS